MSPTATHPADSRVVDDELGAERGTPTGARRTYPTLAEVRARRAQMRKTMPEDIEEEAEDESRSDDWCEDHGFVQHMLVHEAGHAIAALDEGIAFEAIVLYAEERAPASPGSMSLGVAQVTFSSPDNRTWASPDPVAGLRFAMAGAYAEMAVLAHEYPGSGDGDVKAWTQGVELPAVWQLEDVDRRLGCAHEEVLSDVDAWAVCNRERVKGLATMLAERRAEEAPDKDVRVSYDDVKTFLAQCSTDP
jgi:hypothetical protein